MLMAVLWVMTPIPSNCDDYLLETCYSLTVIVSTVPATALVPLALFPLLGVSDGQTVARSAPNPSVGITTHAH